MIAWEHSSDIIPATGGGMAFNEQADAAMLHRSSCASLGRVDLGGLHQQLSRLAALLLQREALKQCQA